MSVYTSKGLASLCGISLRTLSTHVRQNVCGLQKARTLIPGLKGYSYDAARCRKYIAQMTARKKEPSTHIAL